ncbi:hypothetical protein L9F63_014613 [Diploptera punctata]|uniref:Mitochondrial import inner membrane translocase subunit n=1 Tax=Diploptera punctata TaxID=6984 RepID=A0AAD8A928_DIPPU|nr:hypothetical protein L9F63_014613 [Diploptera punctata]
MDPGPMDAASLRNFKDFLQLFNVIAESCFLRCVHTFHTRGLTEEEAVCVSRCTNKHVKVNNKIMEIYMEVQPLIVNKRIEEMNALQEKQKEAQASQTKESENNKTES